MGRGRGAHVSTDERIEQALAWGRSHSWIRRTLGVDQDEIVAAIDRMEQACVDADGDCPACGGYYARIRMHLATSETCRDALAGPAHPEAVRELVDAVCPPQPRRAANLRGAGAA